VQQDNPKQLESSIIDRLAATWNHFGAEQLTAQRDADISRFITPNPVTHTPDGIRDHARDQFIVSLETLADRYHDERWRSGAACAILQGRLSLLRELLDWLKNEED
jgi:hypothetical protein